MRKPTIPLVDLKAQYQRHKKEIDQAIKRVLKDQIFVGGSAVSEFEKAFAKYIGTNFAIGVDSGTSALELILRALEIEPGDEVVTPCFSFIATAAAISHVGAEPVFVDIEPETYHHNISQIEAKISPKTKVLLPVHLYGRALDLEPLLKLAKRHKLHLVEDACQAHGALYRGKKVGSFGIASAFSFYPGKNLGAYGDGGAVTTNDSDLAKRVQMLRHHGQLEKNRHEIVGYTKRLDALQAAILLTKLPHLDRWNEKRRKIAQKYRKLLVSLKNIHLPEEPKDPNSHVWHVFVVEADDRDKLLEYLNNQGIVAAVHYPLPIHLQAAYQAHPDKKGAHPVAEKVAARILSLPIFPELTEAQINRITQKIKEFYSNDKKG